MFSNIFVCERDSKNVCPFGCIKKKEEREKEQKCTKRE